MLSRAAVREAVERHEGPLLAYVSRLVGDLERARDIVQDAYLSLCQQQTPPNNVKSWLYATSRHRAIDVARKEKRMTALAEPLELPATQTEPLAKLEAQESLAAVTRQLNTLTALQQEAVRLKFQQQFSYKEIAEVMRISVSHVGVLLHEALRELRCRFPSPPLGEREQDIQEHPMITDDRITAYALDETDGAERKAIEQYLATHPEAQAEVAAIRALAANLTASLATEASPAVDGRTLATVAPKQRPWNRVAVMALAASVMIATGIGLFGILEIHKVREADVNKSLASKAESEARESTALETASDDSKRTLDLLRQSPRVSTPQPEVGAIAGGIPRAYYQQPGSETGWRVDPPLALDPRAIKRVDEATKQPADTRSRGSGAVTQNHSVDAKPAAPGRGGYSGYDRFPALEENAFVKVEGQAALSTFGVDVDTASYSMVRKFLTQNQMPPPGAIRLEEIVNYFPYRDAPPTGADPFAVTVEMADCPWQPKNRLVRIGLKAKAIEFKERPPSNLVFLIDVSGSMNDPRKLPLVKASMKLLVEQLGENDRVALVVYAGTTGLVLDSTSAGSKWQILEALERLEAGGSTNGAGGIQLAYDTAIRHFIPNGTNRVILCTDGDWNVGTTSTDELIKLIEEKRKSNVFLSVCGFGMGNLRDEMMVNLAGKGNGNYHYIDTLAEARKVFIEQLGGTLVTVAKDVKIQVEFNPAKVGAYRLLGYEKRKLDAADFHNDAKDAGEMGAGHVVTALYEITPAGTDAPGAGKIDELRYQNPTVKKDSNEVFTVKLRHKPPAGDVSSLRELPFSENAKPYGEASEDFRFAAAAASYAMLLRDSPHKGNATYAAVLELAGAAKTWDAGGYRAEFLELVKKAKAISGKP